MIFQPKPPLAGLDRQQQQVWKGSNTVRKTLSSEAQQFRGSLRVHNEILSPAEAEARDRWRVGQGGWWKEKWKKVVEWSEVSFGRVG